MISSAVLAPISEAFVTAIKTFARQGQLDTDGYRPLRLTETAPGK